MCEVSGGSLPWAVWHCKALWYGRRIPHVVSCGHSHLVPLQLAGYPLDKRSSGEVLCSAITGGSYSRRDLSQFLSDLLEAPRTRSEVKETSPHNTAKAHFEGIFSRTFQSGTLHTFPYVSS